MNDITLELREKNRLTWENLVITYINCGYSKSDAQTAADESIRYDESGDFEEDNDDKKINQEISKPDWNYENL